MGFLRSALINGGVVNGRLAGGVAAARYRYVYMAAFSVVWYSRLLNLIVDAGSAAAGLREPNTHAHRLTSLR